MNISIILYIFLHPPFSMVITGTDQIHINYSL